MPPFSDLPKMLWPVIALVRVVEFCIYRVLTTRFAVSLQRRFARPDIAAWRWESDPIPSPKKVCVFVTYSPDGIIPDRATLHAKIWRDQGFEILFVIALGDYTQQPAVPFGYAISRENIGHDFGAWSRALCEIDLSRTDILAIANDSVFAAPCLSKAIKRAEISNSDMIAFTQNREYRWHTQSYAVVFKKNCIQSDAFRRFWSPRSGSRKHVILTYEMPMARDMKAGGNSIEVLFPLPFYRNPTHYYWETLCNMGFPYVKRSSLLRMYDDWQGKFGAFGFDKELIDRER